jgi:hypothetical protein
VFFQRKMAVPGWQIVLPIAALVVLGYTIYRNVWPYPTMHNPDGSENPAYWFPIVSGGWIALCIVLVIVLGGAARRLGQRLTADEGFTTEQSGQAVPTAP